MSHTCHWPSCGDEVPPSRWGCRVHWRLLPKAIRDAIWATYRIGQEIDKRPSPAYLAAAGWAEDYAEGYDAYAAAVAAQVMAWEERAWEAATEAQ